MEESCFHDTLKPNYRDSCDAFLGMVPNLWLASATSFAFPPRKVRPHLPPILLHP